MWCVVNVMSYRIIYRFVAEYERSIVMLGCSGVMQNNWVQGRNIRPHDGKGWGLSKMLLVDCVAFSLYLISALIRPRVIAMAQTLVISRPWVIIMS